MNYKTMLVTLTCLLLSSIAYGQKTTSYDGDWTGKLSIGGRPYEVIVNIESKGGSWKALASGKDDMCAGRKAPIYVLVATEKELQFQVKKSEALAGCPDWTVKLKWVDEKTMKGTSGQTDMTLVRR